jgi:hypothetical protein
VGDEGCPLDVGGDSLVGGRVGFAIMAGERADAGAGVVDDRHRKGGADGRLDRGLPGGSEKRVRKHVGDEPGLTMRDGAAAALFANGDVATILDIRLGQAVGDERLQYATGFVDRVDRRGGGIG